ncbi:protein TUNAR isoform X1 [Anolis sagrei]|uniref:protein TUNAR isoform X1 n=1 Tax=Anolis sagrei TaxID=38937 RepID=UPI00295B90AE|nr:protein TUNAR isoform X1 [Anolis sagrei ordinatus]XP_060611954.1 protein TUNAR isoform X1 [Anolis sagrei ordinatus]
MLGNFLLLMHCMVNAEMGQNRHVNEIRDTGYRLVALSSPISYSSFHPPSSSCFISVSLRRRIKKLATKMVITSGNEEEKNNQEKESKEESILAMLGIIGTILNLVVIIFVYIYTTL